MQPVAKTLFEKGCQFMTIFTLQPSGSDQILRGQISSIQSSQTWWQRSVFYQIYPRSFQDSSGDGIGDLQGITDRLDYLQDLGINALWISPIYPSPMADFGYDVADYCDIDPIFGTLADFDRLLKAAHKQSMHIVLDFIPNHTSDEHPWFVESRNSRENAKRDWYIWRDAKEDGSPPNNWVSFFGGSAWTWDEQTQQYYLHMFQEKQPDLNWRNPDVVEAMHQVLHFWLKRGVDGFRMDAVTMLVKHVDLPDMPVIGDWTGIELLQRHIYVHNQPELHNLLRGFRQICDSYEGNRVILGETGDLDPLKLVEYYGAELDELHIPFNFTSMEKPWQAAEQKKAITTYYATLPPGVIPNFVFGNHDISRLASRYGYANHRSVGMLLLTLQGVPTLYYGDELGMTDGVIPPEKTQDPVGLYFLDSASGRDPARTPMQWNNNPNAGFAPPEIDPWLPVADNYREINVTAQQAKPNSTLKFYQTLIRLRRTLLALQYGSITFLDETPTNILAYLRQYEGQCLLVITNFTDREFTLDLSKLARHAALLLSSEFSRMEPIKLERMVVRANESLLLQLDQIEVP
jgi:alpha-glucosidase